MTYSRSVVACVPTRREHSRKVFSLHSSCIAYGNEPTSTTVYSGVALLLKVRDGSCVNTHVAGAGVLHMVGFPQHATSPATPSTKQAWV